MRNHIIAGSMVLDGGDIIQLVISGNVTVAEVKQSLALHGVFHILAFAKTSTKMSRFCGCSKCMQHENLGSSPAHKGQPRMSRACKTVHT